MCFFISVFKDFFIFFYFFILGLQKQSWRKLNVSTVSFWIWGMLESSTSYDGAVGTDSFPGRRFVLLAPFTSGIGLNNGLNWPQKCISRLLLLVRTDAKTVGIQARDCVASYSWRVSFSPKITSLRSRKIELSCRYLHPSVLVQLNPRWKASPLSRTFVLKPPLFPRTNSHWGHMFV